jgi:hypothetical protein
VLAGLTTIDLGWNHLARGQQVVFYVLINRAVIKRVPLFTRLDSVLEHHGNVVLETISQESSAGGQLLHTASRRLSM